MNFCICWANENWTSRWDGEEQEILLAQKHSPQDDVTFARALERMIRDPRYIRIDGRPLLVVYRPGLLPDPLATARRWRHHFARAGLGNPYLVMAQSFGDEDPRPFGFDAAWSSHRTNTVQMRRTSTPDLDIQFGIRRANLRVRPFGATGDCRAVDAL